jgi:hypothetical protein
MSDFVNQRNIFTNGVFFAENDQPEPVKEVKLILTDEKQELYTMVENEQPFSSISYEISDKILNVYIYISPTWINSDKAKLENMLNLRAIETLLYLTPQTDSSRASEYYKVRQAGREIDWDAVINLVSPPSAPIKIL